MSELPEVTQTRTEQILGNPNALEYQRTEGLLQVTNVHNRFMEEFMLTPPKRISDRIDGPDKYIEFATDDQATHSLYIVSQSLKNGLDRAFPPTDSKKWGVSDEEQEKARDNFVFGGGLSDLSFTWRFAPTVARAAVQAFEELGIVSAEDRTRFTLTDWADIIRTGWFSSLMHDLSRTRQGIYANFGTRYEDYLPQSFNDHMKIALGLPEKAVLLDAGMAKEPVDGMTYAVVKISNTMQQALRAESTANNHNVRRMCPIAHRAAAITPELAVTSRHLRSLIDNGEMALMPGQSSDKVVVVQEYTAIDRSLILLADRLTQYERINGQPVIDRVGFMKLHMAHDKGRLPVDVLRWPTK